LGGVRSGLVVLGGWGWGKVKHKCGLVCKRTAVGWMDVGQGEGRARASRAKQTALAARRSRAALTAPPEPASTTAGIPR
jgi:hypothetical protein